jgi:hypothetical protein
MTGDPSNHAEAGSAAPDLSPLLIALLKGVIYRDEASGSKARQWHDLIALQHRVRDYVAVLGLTLVLDEAEGHAFLRSVDRDEQDPENLIPRLVVRRPLSFPVSLLLALLRKKLAEFDAGGQEGGVRLVLSRDDIVEMVRVFLPDASNEVRLIDRVDGDINKVVELGFLRRMKQTTGGPPAFEVRRILKSFVDAQWLAEFDARLASYQRHLEGEGQGNAEGDRNA